MEPTINEHIMLNALFGHLDDLSYTLSLFKSQNMLPNDAALLYGSITQKLSDNHLIWSYPFKFNYDQNTQIHPSTGKGDDLEEVLKRKFRDFAEKLTVDAGDTLPYLIDYMARMPMGQGMSAYLVNSLSRYSRLFKGHLIKFNNALDLAYKRSVTNPYLEVQETQALSPFKGYIDTNDMLIFQTHLIKKYGRYDGYPVVQLEDNESEKYITSNHTSSEALNDYLHEIASLLQSGTLKHYAVVKKLHFIKSIYTKLSRVNISTNAGLDGKSNLLFQHRGLNITPHPLAKNVDTDFYWNSVVDKLILITDHILTMNQVAIEKRALPIINTKQKLPVDKSFLDTLNIGIETFIDSVLTLYESNTSDQDKSLSIDLLIHSVNRLSELTSQDTADLDIHALMVKVFSRNSPLCAEVEYTLFKQSTKTEHSEEINNVDTYNSSVTQFKI